MIELDIWRRLIEMDEMSLFLVGRLLFTNFLWREVAVIIASFTTTEIVWQTRGKIIPSRGMQNPGDRRHPVINMTN